MDVYIGQQMDVYLKAATISKSIDSDMGLGNGTLPFEEETRTSHAGQKPDA